MENESIFLKTFGSTPVNKVLDFLIVHEEFDYPMKDIAKNAGAGYATLKLFWGKLEKAGIVIMTRTVGNAKMYKLNAESKAVRRLKDFYWETARLQTEEIVAKEAVRVVG